MVKKSNLANTYKKIFVAKVDFDQHMKLIYVNNIREYQFRVYFFIKKIINFEFTEIDNWSGERAIENNDNSSEEEVVYRYIDNHVGILIRVYTM